MIPAGVFSQLASAPSVTAWAFNGKLGNVSLAAEIVSLGVRTFNLREAV